MSTPRKLQVIGRKLAVPPLPDLLVERHRIDALMATLISSNAVVVVSATAGAGKTTAVTGGTAVVRRPVAWLTVDHTDQAPGRLVTYLEAALARCLPRLHGAATTALAVGVPHAEATGMLAEAVGDEELIFVIDELERLGESAEAWSVISSMIRYAPPTLRFVLVSRREIPSALCELPPSRTAVVDESDLAFVPEEAEQALARLGRDVVDPVKAVEATGGWVTGVLFEAWRSNGHVRGVGGEADPLHGYLASHILSQLTPDDREFLVTTSLLSEVTVSRAEALGLEDAANRLLTLRTAHLPVTWRQDQLAMRCHPRLREYLLERLERDPAAMRELRTRHGRLLTREGHLEDATEDFLVAGAEQDAVSAAEACILGVIDRGDFAIAERWLAALSPDLHGAVSNLTVAKLMLTVAREDFHHGVRLADELAASGRLAELAGFSGRAAALSAWCYAVAYRPDDARRVLESAEPSREVDAGWLQHDVVVGRKPDNAELSGGPLDALVVVIRYWLGLLSGLTTPPVSGWVDSVTGPWRISALRASGRIREALELSEELIESNRRPLTFEAIARPETLIDAGRTEEAEQAIADARRIVRDRGPLAYRVVAGVIEAKLELRLHHDPAAARAVLDECEAERDTQHNAVLRSLVDTWYGLALLLQGDDAGALRRLRTATARMATGDQLLELPTAAVYLAEAEWRAGDEEASDRAADLALDAARRQGSNHHLLQALHDFPAVVARRIDALQTVDSEWHELGRALRRQGGPVETTTGVPVELREFGRPAIVVDGEERRPRIKKSYQLLAYLIVAPDRAADRAELLDALFDGRSDDSSRAYLRQAVRWLRTAIPADAIVLENGRVRLTEKVRVTSESAEFEARLTEVGRLQGDERLAAALAALKVFDAGEYLPDAGSGWVDERRRRLAEQAAELRYETAVLHLGAGHTTRAAALADAVLAADPLHETAWRLKMQIANALGDDAGVLAAYQACETALGRIGVAPADGTRELADRLRR